VKSPCFFMIFGYFLLSFNGVEICATLPSWTILNYIEADNNVCRFGLKNIEEMQHVGSTSLVNILVQLDRLESKKTLRYKIARGCCVEDASLDQEMGLDPERELVDGVRWASKAYPSEYFMLVFWNHGNGIIDKKKGWEDYKKRGILYNFTNKTYLNNQQMSKALSQIKSKILGKKIDILGMDACLMAMVEIAYQVKNYACYLVASQNIEKVPGWFYSYFLKRLTKSVSPMTPDQLAKSIVSSFALFNKYRNQSYTQSAIKLDMIEELKDRINNVLFCLEEAEKIYSEKITFTIKKAREKCIEFDDGFYVDVHSFFNQLLYEVTTQFRGRDVKQDLVLKILQSALKEVCATIVKAVLLNKVGNNYNQAKGLSIYFPKNYIHESYPLTMFAQESTWLKFLEKFLAQRNKN
jgi:hypothetical protein